MKVNRTVSIDSKINELANQKTNFNVSSICEAALAREVLKDPVSEQDKELLCSVIADFCSKGEQEALDLTEINEKLKVLRDEIALETRKGKDFRVVASEVKRRFPDRSTPKKNLEYYEELLFCLRKAPLSEPPKE